MQSAINAPRRFSAALRRAASVRPGPALALLLDDLFRRAGHEVGVAELGVDLGDLVGEFFDFLLQPRAFGLEVDDLADRQGIGRLADHDLQRGLRCGVAASMPSMRARRSIAAR